ncbi:hypothetical protein PPYR_10405 [Photinus pyralis]|uniref:Uncharacterized protein n=1 Tax=Photinus pyralis TaxID=7054 RepID=A0A5N4AGA4_PHOPY|nr:succinate dehydrogenase cytochrome b560 subunit, mitochondrial-like [Photinus pyralis]KAB0796344.1 hypothetical protein PPYR_10405 [Photinus pyralis]
MSTICRLAGRKLPFIKVGLDRPNFLQLSRHVTLKPVSQPVRGADHDDHNMSMNRPMSPHISIYAFDIISKISISHRITGTMLGGYTILLGTGALVLPNKVSHYVDALQAMHPGAASILALKLVLAAPFAYHFCNGIRHLVWDTARFLTLSGVHKTAYIMLASTFVMLIALLFK